MALRPGVCALRSADIPAPHPHSARCCVQADPEYGRMQASELQKYLHTVISPKVVS